MKVTDSQLLNLENDSNNANAVKDLVLETLNKQQIITEKERDTFANEWHIVIIKKSWFKQVISRLSIKDRGTYSYRFVNFILSSND